MEVLNAIKSRFAERKYEDRPVSREQITTLLDAAHEAPCSCNLQLMQYVVVDDPKVQKELAKIATRKVLWAPVNIVFFIDPRFNTKRHASIMGLGAAMQNMSLVAVSMGLGTCPMAGFKGDKKLKELLSVPDFMEAILIMGVGYPKSSTYEKERERIPVEDISHFNHFSQKLPFIKSSDDLDDWDVTELVNYRKRIAPVYRYSDHFRLHIFPDNVYEKAAGFCLSRLTTDKRSILDLFTYDGRFVKALKDQNAGAEISVSDYYPDTTELMTKQYPEFSYVGIDEKSLISANDEQYDIVTMVHKVDFTPNTETLLGEVSRVLKKEGFFFVTTEKMSLQKRVFYILRKIYTKYLTSEKYNVYDGNPYYKIGPISRKSMGHIKRMCSKSGLRLYDKGEIELESGSIFGTHLEYAIFKK